MKDDPSTETRLPMAAGLISVGLVLRTPRDRP